MTVCHDPLPLVQDPKEPSRLHRGGTNSDDDAAAPDIQQILSDANKSSVCIKPNQAGAIQIVEHQGKTYKLRAYRDVETAGQCWQLLSTVPDLFAHCYGRIGGTLVLEYVPDSRPDNSTYSAEEIASFLIALARPTPPVAADVFFESRCADLERHEVFNAGTIQLIRRRFLRLASAPLQWGIEYLEPTPRNFALTEQGRFLSIDEKHLVVGPRGLGLFRGLQHCATDSIDWLKHKYSAEVCLSDFDRPWYQQLLELYFSVCKLAYGFRNKERKSVLRNAKNHLMRRAILRVIEAPRGLRVREQAIWRGQFEFHRYRIFAKRAAGLVKRHVFMR